jgi:hypothetical protein
MVVVMQSEQSGKVVQQARHILLISGKDSLMTAIIQKTRQPELRYECLFNNTYAELPEVYAWLKKVEAYLGMPIETVGANLEEIIMQEGGLPGYGTAFGRFCTRRAKVEPMEQRIGSGKAFVYYGLRADEPERVGYKQNADYDITPVYPLREMGFTLPLVWHGLEQLDLLPPQFFWQTVYDRVMERLGSYAEFVENLLPWERAYLFAWRTRPNCYYCYNQRVYEWVGLLDSYPDLYWQSAWIEENVGKDNDKKQRVKMFTWRQGEALRELAARVDEVREQRVKDICKMIIKRAQGNMFSVEPFDDLSVSSCGLTCGK